MWVVTRNTPYYNHVKEFSSFQEARDYAQQMIEDYKEYCYSERVLKFVLLKLEKRLFLPNRGSLIMIFEEWARDKLNVQ